MGLLGLSVLTDVASKEIGPGSAAEVAGVVGVVAIGPAMLTFLLGFFLARYSNGARLVAASSSCIVGLAACAALLGGSEGGAVVVPILGFLVLYLLGMSAFLWSPSAAAVCTEAYRVMVAAQKGLPPGTLRSPFFLAPLLLVGIYVGLIAVMMAAMR
jgi:hypothetical protein